jgi:hypothetical protein
MSQLPFTDGSNGNGITCAALLRKVRGAAVLRTARFVELTPLGGAASTWPPALWR